MPAFELCFLSANNAWAFVFGDQLVRLQARDGHIDNRLLFPTRERAEKAAAACGLQVCRDNLVRIAATKKE